MSKDIDNEPVSYRYTFLLLNLINVAHPVSHADLLDAIGEHRRDGVDAALDLLTSRGLVKHLPGNAYRTTWAGQQAMLSRVLRKNRDVQRMWHLSNLSDQCRRSEEGEAS